MAINFPSAPTNGQTHTENGSTWEYSVDEGGVWITVPQTVTGPTGPTGPTGNTGNAGNVQIGTTTTGAEGTSASVTNSGNGTHAVLNFTIPRGAYGANGVNGFSPPVTMTIEYPTNAEKVPMFYTTQAITVTRLVSVLQGTATPTVTFNVAYGPILSDTGTNIITTGWILNNTTYGAVNTTFNNASIGVNNWIWITTSAVTGTVNSLTVTVATTPT
jgi:hypothetical protein